jgi:hypothetical protein
MTPSLLLLASLALAAEPEKVQLPVRMLPLETDPACLRVDCQRLFLSGFHSHKLSAVPASGNKAAQVLWLDTAGGDLVLAGNRIFVGEVFGGSLLVVDRASFTPLASLPLGGEGSLAATRDGRTVFFASNKADEFYIIDSRTFAHRTVAYPPGGHGIGCLELSPDEKRLYLGIQRGGRMSDGNQLSGGNCFLAIYDLAERQYAGTVYLAQQVSKGSSDDAFPTSLAFAPDGKRLYVGTLQSRAGIRVVDLQKLELLDDIDIPLKQPNPVRPWSDPMSVAIFDRWLLAAVRSNQEVVAIDLASHRIVARLTHSAAVDLERVVVGDNQVYLFGGSSAMTIVDGADLSRLLLGIERQKTGPVAVTLIRK